MIDPNARDAQSEVVSGAVKVSYANSTAPNKPFTPTPSEGQQPVAWGEFYGGKIVAVSLHKSHHYTVPLYTRPSERTVTEADPLDQVELLFLSARVEADKAMRKFPQPNYVISKVAEEAGEVVKAAIHCAEGRETPENVVAEIRQAMAMLIRLYVEGDQVHGLPPLKAAMEAGR